MGCVCKKTTVENLKTSHVALNTVAFEKRKIERGYADRILHINVSNNDVQIKEVPQEVKEKFIGGRGYGLYYLWKAVKPETRWNSEENAIVMSPGPIAGITQYPGAGKTYVVAISPLTDIPIDSNVGGYFGPLFKFSGFDALEITGKAKKDIIIFIDGENNKVSIEEAPNECVDSHILAEVLTDMYSVSEEDKRNVSVISAGSAAENSFMGLLNFSYYDVRRKHCKLKQAGRGGIGTVFRDKKIKAVVVRKANVKGDTNSPADLGKIIQTGIRLHKEIHQNDGLQANMRLNGTARLIEAMNDYDLVPVYNFKYGSHPDAYKMSQKVWQDKMTQDIPDGCWYGCTLQCSKSVDGFELRTGPYKGQKVIVDGPEYETAGGVGTNCGIFNPDDVLECNFYCDTYGIDTISFGTTCAFLMECYEAGILNKERTCGLELHFGNWDAQMELLHQMSRGEGFGKTAGMGVKKLKEFLVKEYGANAHFLRDIGMEAKGLEYSEYVTKESLAQQAGYATANKGAQHDENWLIFMDMVNNQIPTFEDKAEALHYFPLFRTWFSLVGLCKLPWNDIEPANNFETDEPSKVPEHVQNYVDLFNGVTGSNIDKEELIRQSERVYNFQRVFNLRMGKGTREFDYGPYRSMGPVTKEEYLGRKQRYDEQLKDKLGLNPENMTLEDKMAALRKYKEDIYEKLLDAVYKRRGWTNNAIPTIDTLKDLGMDLPEVIGVVKKYL